MNRATNLLASLLWAAAFSMAAVPAFSQAGPPRVLTVGMGSYETELNPYKSIYAHEMQIFTGIYEGLFAYDAQSLDPVRAQAESFEKSRDGKTWTFRIRKDARWSDGTSVTAKDYVQSWLYLLSPTTKAEYAVFFDIIRGAKAFRTGKSRKPDSVGITAIDDRTLVVELDAPAAYFTRLLCHSSFVPIHASLRGVRSWKPEAIVGNGPYTIESMDKTSLVLRKSATYWDADKVAVPAIRVVFMEDDKEATRLYNDGEIDWLTDMVDLDTLVDTDSIQSAPMFATGYYFWNASRKPWKDARVRRALSLLIPWEQIRTGDKYYAPTSVLVLPFSGYESPPGIDGKNEKEALDLLSKAGFPEGKGLPPVRFVAYKSESNESNLKIISEAWQRVGVTVETVEVPDGASARDIRQEGYTISFTSWIGDFADPAAFLLMWTSDSGLNEGGYKSLEFDKLVARSMTEDGKLRLSTLAEAEAKLLNDAPLLPLYHSVSFNVLDPNALAGWFQNPLDIHPFKALSFGTPKARPFVAKAASQAP
jgi:oligopeptide transport system substrate-binding protein